MSKIKDKIGSLKENHKIALWLWAAVAYILALILLFLVIKTFVLGQESKEKLLQAGKMAIINLETSEIQGNIRNSDGKIKATDNPSHEHNEGEHSSVDANEHLLPNKEGLKYAPFDKLSEQSDKGIIPKAGDDGTLAWRYYGRPYNPPKEKRPVVAVIFTNLALSRPLTEEVIKLQHNFTLSFSPYAGDVKKWLAKAREEGFESLVDLPMQSENYPISDPGQYGLLEDANPNENAARLRSVLSRFPGFVGVTAWQNEKLTANSEMILPYISELTKRGILFIYVKNAKNTAIAEMSKSRSLYTIGIDKIIDEEISRSAIESQLQDLTILAKNQGYAIGLAHSYPPSTEALGRWADSLAAQDIDLVPISEIAKRIYK